VLHALFAAVLSALLVAPALAAPERSFAPPSDDQVVAYRHATLIDGTGRQPQPGMTIVVKGERILSIAKDSTAERAIDHARVVDLAGRYLIPGLIDSHVHIATGPDRPKAEEVLRRDVYGGVTAVRDMADDLRYVGEAAREARLGEIAAPDIYYAALMAGPAFFADPRPGVASEGEQAGSVPWMQAVDSRSDIPLSVALARGTSATAIKLYAAIDADLARRVIAEAHRQKSRVWAHATLFPATPIDLVRADVDSISHIDLVGYAEATPLEVEARCAPFSRIDPNHSPAIEQLFREMVTHSVILDPTIWRSELTNRVYADPPRSCRRFMPTDLAVALVRKAYRAGVPISAGTDFIGSAQDPWPEVFHELEALANRAGLPPLQVLRSATLIGAQAAGQDAIMGSIAVGKLANMVVLAKDPSRDIGNLKSIVFTIKRGRVFARSEFAAGRPSHLSGEDEL
jgi:imidazolonepropionase-like amidohydrolase